MTRRSAASLIIHWLGCAGLCAAVPACSSSSVAPTTPLDGGTNPGVQGDSGSVVDSSPPSDATRPEALDAALACTTDDAGTTHLASFVSGPLPGTTDSFASAENLSADASAVYVSLLVSDFADGSSASRIDVVRVPLDCGPATLLASKEGQDDVWNSIVAGDRLYLEMTDGIYSVPTAGGALTTEAATRPLIPGTGPTFAVANRTIAWIDENGALWTVAAGSGQAPSALANAPSGDAGLGAWTSIAADSANVYATANPAPVAGDAGGDDGVGSIVSIPLAGGAATVIVTGQHIPGQLMVNGATIYWTNSFATHAIDTASSHGPILSLTLPSGAPVTLVSDDTAPSQLTIRGSTLTWIANGGADGEDLIHALTGSAVTVVPTPFVLGLDGLTLGPKGAYWTPGGQDLYGIAF